MRPSNTSSASPYAPDGPRSTCGNGPVPGSMCYGHGGHGQGPPSEAGGVVLTAAQIRKMARKGAGHVINEDGDVESLEREPIMCCCGISRNKFMSTVPWYPILALLGLITGGTLLLVGVRGVGATVGISVSDGFGIIAQGSVVGILAVLDIIFTYSVFSNKLRIHNIHKFEKSCAGYGITETGNCCVALVGIICKVYNSIIFLLSWLALVVSILLSTTSSAIASIILFLIYLCGLKVDTVDEVLEQLRLVNALASNLTDTSPDVIGGGGSLLSVNSTVTATQVCSASDSLQNSSFLMMTGGIVVLGVQITMWTSYNVVHEVAWRHLKDKRRKKERDEAAGSGPSGPPTTAQCGGSGYGNYGCCAPPPHNSYPGVAPPHGGGYGGAPMGSYVSAGYGGSREHSQSMAGGGADGGYGGYSGGGSGASNEGGYGAQSFGGAGDTCYSGGTGCGGGGHEYKNSFSQPPPNLGTGWASDYGQPLPSNANPQRSISMNEVL